MKKGIGVSPYGILAVLDRDNVLPEPCLKDEVAMLRKTFRACHEVAWLWPENRRFMTIVGEKGMLVDVGRDIGQHHSTFIRLAGRIQWNTIINKVGPRTQPCLVPSRVRNVSEGGTKGPRP